jgi:hypothetical protein
MLRQWISKGVPLFHIVDITITPIANQTTYLLGPGATTAFATFRPIKMLLGRLSYTTQSPALDIPLIPLSRQEYTILGQKGSQGPPNSWYYDPQLNQGLLQLYLTPDSITAGDAVAIMTCQRPMQAMINQTDNFDFSDEWINPIKYCLAAEMLEDYEVPAPKAARIGARADAYREEAFAGSVEEAATVFSPDTSQGYHFRGRG